MPIVLGIIGIAILGGFGFSVTSVVVWFIIAARCDLD